MSTETEVRARIAARAESFADIDVPLAETYGTDAIDPLIGCLEHWQLARAALEELARFPLAVKREQIYPRVAAEAASHWCDPDGPRSSGFELERMVAFFVSELAVCDDLAEIVFAALEGRRAVTRVHPHFFTFVRATRDKRAIAHIRNMANEFYWGDAALALWAEELGDDLLAGLTERMGSHAEELVLATALLGGAKARAVLLEHYHGGGLPKDAYAMALAFFGDPQDAALIKSISTRGLGATAKRVHAALTKPKVKDRLKALDALAKKPNRGSLMLACQLLTDEEAQVSHRCAELLRDYAADRGEYQENIYHLRFLNQAAQAIESGTISDKKTLAALNQVAASIPRATVFTDDVPAPEEPEPEPEVVSPGSVERNLELEKIIADDPDDSAGYLVYGDWLQARGQPRGEAILFAHATREKPKDKKLAAAAEKAIAGERKSLSFRKQVALEYHLGFIRSARLSFAKNDTLIAAFSELIGHPAACVVQELRIDALPNRDLDHTAIENTVIEQSASLGALRRLFLDKPGRWSIPERVYEALPRLRSGDAKAWNDVLEAVANHGKRLKVPFDGDKLPKLVFRDPSLELEVEPKQVLLGLRVELDKQRPIGIVDTMRQVFTPDSLDAFALGLMNTWIDGGERGADKWAYQCAGVFGGPNTAARIGGLLATWSNTRAVQGVDYLRQIGSPVAIQEIKALEIMPSRYYPRRQAAGDAIAMLAGARDIGVGDLLVRFCPRSVAPTTRQRAIETETRWLFDLMLSGERIAVPDFLDELVAHALRAPLVAGLLWAQWNGKQVRPFRLENGKPVNADGSPCELNVKARIGVIHPLELDAKQRESWAAVFAKNKIEQPFSQVDRPIRKLNKSDLGATMLDNFAKRRVGFDQIRNGLEALDWAPEVVDHGIESFSRTFARGNVTIVGDISTGAIGEVWWYSGRRSREAFSNLHPVVISEFLYDIERALGGRSRQERQPVSQETSKTPAMLPQSGRYPFAELAKSGRSKCVVCEEKIEKGSVRIAVERIIETPRFTGKASAWLHPACRGECPELKAIDDGGEALLTRNSAGIWPPKG